MFPNGQWNLSGLQKLIRKIDETCSADGRQGQWSTAHWPQCHEDQRGSRTLTESGRKAPEPQ